MQILSLQSADWVGNFCLFNGTATAFTWKCLARRPWQALQFKYVWKRKEKSGTEKWNATVYGWRAACLHAYFSFFFFFLFFVAPLFNVKHFPLSDMCVPSAYAIFLAQFVKQFCIQIATAAALSLTCSPPKHSQDIFYKNSTPDVHKSQSLQVGGGGGRGNG